MASNTPKRRTTKSKATAAGKVAASAVEPKKKRRKIDWEAIELDYRAAIKTLRQIGKEHDITHAAVAKRAKRDGWDRDLSAKIQARADALVTKEAVTSLVTTEDEKRIVDANARAVADVRLAHRKDIHRARALTNAMLDELQAQTDPENLEALRGLGEIMRDPDGRDKLNELYHYVISLPERSKTLKSLGDTLERLVNMERRAFGLDKAEPSAADPFKAMLDRISANGGAIQPVQKPSGNALTPKDDE